MKYQNILRINFKIIRFGEDKKVITADSMLPKKKKILELTNKGMWKINHKFISNTYSIILSCGKLLINLKLRVFLQESLNPILGTKLKRKEKHMNAKLLNLIWMKITKKGWYLLSSRFILLLRYRSIQMIKLIFFSDPGKIAIKKLWC